MNLIQIALKEEAANVPETPRSQVGSRNFSMTRTTWAAIALLVVALGALGHFGVSVYDGAEERRVRISIKSLPVAQRFSENLEKVFLVHCFNVEKR